MTSANLPENISPAEQRRKLLAQLLRDKARLSQAVFPATTAQRGVWFMQQLDPTTHAYHLSFCVRVTSPIDPKCARSALQQLIDRHSMLRTTFRFGQQLEMVVHGAGDAAFTQVDAAGWSDQELESSANRCFRQPFDLQNGPLVRLDLFSRSQTDHVFLLALHHLICDGWSLGIVIQEFMECYQAEAAGRPSQLPSRVADFSEFALGQQQRSAGPAAEQSKAYWLQRLSGGIPRLDLPTSHSSEESTATSSAVHYFDIDESLCRRLSELSQSCGVTLFGVILAAYQTFLMRVSGQQDILLGVPMAGRNQPGFEGVVGHFVNLVAVRGDLSGEPTFREFVARTWKELQSVVENQEFPFLELVRLLRPAGRTERNPFFRTILNILKPGPDHPMSFVLTRHADSTRWGPWIIRQFPLESLDEHYDLSVRVLDTTRSLQFKLQYDRNLFESDLIEQFGRCLQELLKSIADNPDRPLSQLSLLDPEDRGKMVVAWNATSAEYPRDKAVHQLLAEQALRTPDVTALVTVDAKLSYRELHRSTNRLAHYLRNQGIGRNELVAVCADRSSELVIALLGTLKAGAAYVPVDPRYPADRIQLMLEDSGAQLVLTTAASDQMIGSLTSARRFCLDRDWQQLAELPEDEVPSITEPLDLAYVIYTSGSTGRPKGVQIPHRALVNFLWSMRERPGLSSADVLLSVTTFSFDIFGLELFLPLMVGARLELAGSNEMVDGALLAKRLSRCGATVMQATPVTWRLLLAAGFQRAGRLTALCGGEAMSPELARQLLDTGVELWNMYGPTETTIWSCIEHVREPGDQRISIGRPIANTQVYVLDSQLQPVPVGVVGHLYIGGDGLASGYLKRPELTAERFIANPFDADGQLRIYNTGDLARFLSDGRLECLGRSDHQVKIRGYRIELEEIESVLSKHPQIAQAVVAVREDRPGNQWLAAYYVPAVGAADPGMAGLRPWLEKKLPPYMIPGAFVPLSALPVTPNGKVDRGKLPAPQAAELQAASKPSAASLPMNHDEQFLIDLWKELLGRNEISPTDNFFEIGGHSLLAAQMFARLEALYRRPLPVALLFSAPTVRELSQAIDQFPPVKPGPHVFAFQSEGSEPPLFLMPSLAGDVLQWREFVDLLPANRPICAIYMAGEPNYAQETTLEELAKQCAQAIAQAYPGVPCHLCGYSFGGILGFEVARQLHAMGCEVGIVTIVDIGPAERVTDSFRQILLNSPQILRNLLSRTYNALLGKEWRNELRGAGFKFRLVRRRLTAKKANVEHQQELAFEYLFGRIQMPDKTRRLMSWSLKLQAGYRPKLYHGNLLLLRASKRPLLGPFEYDLGWGQYVDGHIEVADFSGGHGQMIEQAQLAKIAGLLTSAFEGFKVASPPVVLQHQS
jgi:amino acid adenylation domain-containing protein